MTRKKSDDTLKREWASLSKDWFSVYQWSTLGTSAYTEQAAALILADYARITLNVAGLRQERYAMPTHHGQGRLKTDISQFTEKRFVRAMYNLREHPALGTLLDYEVPLKATQSAQHGDIDLLCLDGASLLVIEVKQQGSHESALKALLQAYTYARLAQSVWSAFSRSFELAQSIRLVPTVLALGASEAGRQLHHLAEYPNTRALIERLNRDLAEEGLGQIGAFLGTDCEQVLSGCLEASPDGQGESNIHFKPGYVPQFRRILS